MEKKNQHNPITKMTMLKEEMIFLLFIIESGVEFGFF